MSSTPSVSNAPRVSNVPSGSNLDGTNSRTPLAGYESLGYYEHSRRQVSSVVVSEEVVGELPETGGVRYVEIPVVEVVTKHVPKREIREVEKIVPRTEYEYIERTVEVPQIQYVDKTVEKLQYQDVIVTKPVKVVQDVPREIVKQVAKPIMVPVEKIVEVGSNVVEVLKPYRVENKIPVRRFQDRNFPVVVAQTIQPVITTSEEIVDVDVYEYEPQVIPVDIHVAKPIAATLVAVGAVQETHQIVNIPAAQYNSTLRSINSHLGQEIDALPYIKDGDVVPFLSGHEMPGTISPAPGVAIHGMGSNEVNMTFGTYEQQRDGSYYQYPGGMGGTIDNTYSTGQINAYTYAKGTAESLKLQSQNTKSHRSNKSLATATKSMKRRGCRC